MKTLYTKLNYIIVLIIIVCNCCSVFANSDAPSSILWEVRSKSDTSKVAYLLGSVHIACSEMYPLNSVIMDAWNKCSALAVEINIMDIDASSLLDITNLDASSISLISFFMKLFSLTEKLSDKLPADLYLKTKNILIKNGIPEEYIDNLTPFGVVLSLQLGDISRHLFNKDSLSADGIDLYFLKQARLTNKPIYELESIEIQLKLLMSISDMISELIDGDIISYLESQLENLSGSDADINDLFTAWRTGDIKSIENIINSPFSTDANLNDKIMNAFLYNRNTDMSRKIENYLTDKERYFIVIGAGHYVGNKSIIDILQKTGKYYIKRL